MATTTNYGFEKPTVGGNEDTWGELLNGNWDDLDALLGGVSATEFGYLDGVTSAIQTQLDAKSAIANPVFTGQVNAGDSIRLGNWVIFDDGGSNLYFQYNGNNVFRIDGSGNIYAEGNVTAYVGV